MFLLWSHLALMNSSKAGWHSDVLGLVLVQMVTFINFLESSVSEWGEVTSGVLLVHGLSSDTFGNHISKDSHHGGTAIVELNGTLGEVGLLIKIIPAEVNVSVTE
eukprot:340041_1